MTATALRSRLFPEYLQAEYLKLGISIKPDVQEEQSYRDNMKAGNFDMVFNICRSMPYDPQSSLAAMREPCYGDYAARQGLWSWEEVKACKADIYALMGHLEILARVRKIRSKKKLQRRTMCKPP